MADTPILSVVVPVFNEEEVLPTLLDRLGAAVDSTGADAEFVFVNDGSADRSLDLLRERQQRDGRIVILNLARNFGHQAALTAGLRAARGDAVILMDADLQDPPEMIREFVARWHKGYKVVLASRESRAERGVRRWLLDLFYKVFRWMGAEVRVESGIFGLMDRRIVDLLNEFTERHRYLPGLRNWLGFATTSIHYHRDARVAGVEKQTLGKLLHYGLDAIFSFSNAPLRLSLLVGIIVSGLSISYGLILFVQRILGIDVVRGFTTPTVAILVLSGVQLITIGILGEYVARIYDEVKRRPLYIVDEVIRAGEHPDD